MIENALPVGSVLKGANEYTIEQPLHQGGFGITYLAKARIMVGNIPQTVTFTIKEFFIGKICRRGPQASVTVAETNAALFKQAKADFRHEAEMLHSLKHPHIVPVNEVFEQNNTIYYVMAYLGHVSLAQYVTEQGGHLSEAEATSIISDLSGAVAHLHHQRILHLDLKPDNVMMQPTAGGGLSPVLIDFGQAVSFEGNRPKRSKGVSGYSQGYSDRRLKQTVTEFLPELDIYSLAATLHFMLTGVAPADAATLTLHKACRVLPEQLSPHTLDAVLRGLQLVGNAPLTSVASFLTVLQQGAEAEEGSGRRPTDTIDADSSHRISNDLLRKASLILAVLVVVGGVGYFSVRSLRSCSGGGNADTLRTDTTRTDTTSADTTKADTLRIENKTISDTVAQKGEPQTQSNTPNKEEPPSNKREQPSNAKKNESSASTSSKPASQPASTSNSSKSKSTYGTANLGYATWRGELLNGKPHGNGIMKFRTSHSVSRCRTTPVAGDYIDGFCENGVLITGRLYHSDGEIVETF